MLSLINGTLCSIANHRSLQASIRDVARPTVKVVASSRDRIQGLEGREKKKKLFFGLRQISPVFGIDNMY